MKLRLLDSIGEKRLEHSIRVMEEAEKLALVLSVDKKKAGIAGLLHDCGRYSKESDLLKKTQEFGIILDEIYSENINLLHAHLGSQVARKEYNISDKDILNAIKYHTTGRADMSILEKIVYVADYIEPRRNFEGIEEIRHICYQEKDIDKAIFISIDNTIRYLLDRKSMIHEDTIRARNFLLDQMK